MSEFHDIDPSRENCWRAVVLFGQNSASYKFALAKALLEMGNRPNDFVRIDELAEPFSRHLMEHLRRAPKQITRKTQGKFLDACQGAVEGRLSQQQLLDATTRLGFVNVIDAFHIVNREEVPVRFFLDERKTHRGIRLTDAFFKLATGVAAEDLPLEAEARWRLVETAWALRMSHHVLTMTADLKDQTKPLYTVDAAGRRQNVTSCREALNGYQKGRCFYCFDPISIASGHTNLADVDHFLPHMLQQARGHVWTASTASPGAYYNLDGVWNLVLACKECNRGVGGKFASVPTLALLERLSRRNNYFVESHHPLRETIMNQTGKQPKQRQAFLQSRWQRARETLIHTWQPEPKAPATF